MHMEKPSCTVAPVGSSFARARITRGNCGITTGIAGAIAGAGWQANCSECLPRCEVQCGEETARGRKGGREKLGRNKSESHLWESI